jgi:hypothetical protein
MDWTCWTQAFSAMYEDPSDAKRAVKEFHLAVIATRLIGAYEPDEQSAHGEDTRAHAAESEAWNH